MFRDFRATSNFVLTTLDMTRTVYCWYWCVYFPVVGLKHPRALPHVGDFSGHGMSKLL